MSGGSIPIADMGSTPISSIYKTLAHSSDELICRWMCFLIRKMLKSLESGETHDPERTLHCQILNLELLLGNSEEGRGQKAAMLQYSVGF